MPKTLMSTTKAVAKEKKPEADDGNPNSSQKCTRSPFLLPKLAASAALGLGIGFLWGRRTNYLSTNRSDGNSGSWVTYVLIPDFVTLRTWALSFSVASLVGREIWRNIPQWLKRQLVPGFSTTRTNIELSEDASNNNTIPSTGNTDMTSLLVIGNKLRSLFDLASEKLNLADPNHEENQYLEVALIVLLQLVAKVKKYRGDLCDSLLEHEDLGQLVNDPKQVLKGYDELFELADLAYNEIPDGQTLGSVLRNTHGLELLRHDSVVLPGAVAHYIALNRATKQAVIAVKGTSSFEDILTDCCGVAVEFGTMRCHDGILTASQRLANDIETVLTDLLVPCGFHILLTGHSLGK